MSCKTPCDPCAPPAKPGQADTTVPTRYRIVAESGPILAATGAQQMVQFPCAGRIYAVRGAPTALGDHTSLDAALMSIRVGWSVRNADPGVRQDDGTSAGTASHLSLFGRELDRDPLSENAENGICIGKDDKVLVTWSDADGGDESEAELVFWFEPKVS